jgi:hypothetical protein
MGTALRFLVGSLAKIQESGNVSRNLDNNITALAAITTVRTSERDKFFPAE